VDLPFFKKLKKTFLSHYFTPDGFLPLVLLVELAEGLGLVLEQAAPDFPLQHDFSEWVRTI
jgi:hypothetical protein